jgi:hypothetical protein
MMDETDNPWSMLRQHWNEAAKRERDNPPADKPPYEFIFEHGSTDMDAAPETGCYAIENGSAGVFYVTSWNMGKSWFAHDAGDLWPCKPTQWWPLKSWPLPAPPREDGR